MSGVAGKLRKIYGRMRRREEEEGEGECDYSR